MPMGMVDSGMVVVGFISLVFLSIVFVLLFYDKNEWCDLLFKNMTENLACRPRESKKSAILFGSSRGDQDFLAYNRTARMNKAN